MTNLNQKLSSFYNAKEELCREERKHIEDRKNENKPTTSFETVEHDLQHLQIRFKPCLIGVDD